MTRYEWVRGPHGRWRVVRRPDGLWIVEGYHPRSQGGKYWCHPATAQEAYLWRRLTQSATVPLVVNASAGGAA